MTLPEQKLELTIDISVRQPNYSGGTIQLRETLQLPAAGFLELCYVLAQFDALAKKLKEGQ